MKWPFIYLSSCLNIRAWRLSRSKRNKIITLWLISLVHYYVFEFARFVWIWCSYNNLFHVNQSSCFWIFALTILFFYIISIFYLKNWILFLLSIDITGKWIYDHPCIFYFTPFIKTNIPGLKKSTSETMNENIDLLSRRITKICALQRLRAKFWPLRLRNEIMLV